MSASNKIKNIIFLFGVILTLLLFVFPSKTFAKEGSLSFTRVENVEDRGTGKWNWKFSINTTNIPDETVVYVSLYKNNTYLTAASVSISTNYAHFETGYALDSSTSYKLMVSVAQIGALSLIYPAETTPASGGEQLKNPAPIVVKAEIGDKGTEKVNTDTTYTLIQPIPGMDTTIDTDRQCTKDANGKETCANPCPLGNYLNIIFKVFLGICAVLAMIMIVWGGIQYMTSELVSSKEAGRESITHAILGLILALSAYLILNTLNPDLLNICLNTLPKVQITLEDDYETEATALTQSSGTPPGGATVGCKEGIVTVTTNNGGTYYICQPYANKVKNLVNAAWASSIKLTGGSYRSKSAQEKLRANHCGGQQNVYKEKASCTPLTAVPGRSRHENGLAIDFSCDGKLINLKKSKNTEVCFNWLKANAGNYGLKNLPQENWHWSTDGR